MRARNDATAIAAHQFQALTAEERSCRSAAPATDHVRPAPRLSSEMEELTSDRDARSMSATCGDVVEEEERSGRRDGSDGFD